MTEPLDVLVLGSGFGGSLLSMILARSGLRTAVVDRATHPRFAIGESSTPLADAVLLQLAREFDLPEIIPLAKYGTWKQQRPDLTCGLKRGFSYFGHVPEQIFSANDQMLVAASTSDAASDTHWLRSEVDAWLVRRAKTHGVRAFEGARYALTKGHRGWQVEGTAGGSSFCLRSPFVVDATGAAGEVLRYLRVPSQTHLLRTRSRSVFAHFANVPTVGSLLDEQSIARDRHPFPCDAAAVHHVLDRGWMWQLRFDDDTVSAGLAFDDPHSVNNAISAGSWQQQIRRFPFLEKQFANARIVRPEGGLRVTGRLQRLTSQAAGADWAALPNTAGFIDPLHSTGIAHTLFGVRRIARVLLSFSTEQARGEPLTLYGTHVLDELRQVDSLVEGCYASLPSFRLWCRWCMLYFAAVTTMEQSDETGCSSFLKAHDTAFRDMLTEARVQLQRTLDEQSSSDSDESFDRWLRDAVSPWNHVGLLAEGSDGMYAQTSAPSE